MKKLLEDIVRPEHEVWNHEHETPSLSHEIIQTMPRERILDPHTRKRHFSPRIIVWIIVVLLLAWSVVAVLHRLRESVVTIDPFTQSFNLKDNLFSAKKGGTPDELKYEIINIKNDISTNLTGIKNTSSTATFAKGTIGITNTDIKQKLTLPKGTIFVDSNGNEYESIAKSTILPAKKVKTDIVISHSTIDIKAKEAGAKHNSDSVILGFKDTKLTKPSFAFDAIKISGGKDAGAYEVAGDQLQNTYKDLNQKLKDKLFIQAQAQLPEGFIIFKNGGNYKISGNNQIVTGQGEQIPVTLSGEASFLIFDRKNLERVIAESSGVKDESSTYTIPKIADLDIEYVSMVDENTANIKISGKGIIVWRIDDKEIKDKILDTSKNNLKAILKDTKSIADINMKITPFWEQNLPSRKDRITIIVNNPLDRAQ